MLVLTNPNCLWMAVEDFDESPVIAVSKISQRIMAGGRRLPAWLARKVLFTLPLGRSS
jgi:hypothetical protein